jgi:DNA-binding IclR family transcriptional regulator
VASGKALLAALHFNAQTLQTQLGPLQAYTPNTITNVQSLEADLIKSRNQGWAENREEWRLGVCGLGVPVFNARAEPVAAIGMSVPSIRFTRAQARTMAQKLCDTALQASQALGFSPVHLTPNHPARRSR